MRIDTCVSGSPSQVFILPVGYMLLRFSVTIFFGQPKINNMDLGLFFVEPYEEVVGFDISMKKIFSM